ncbi:MAG TPA: DUF2785 domain-containing protein [Halanaerobiales bacterium]|nr:DUF2785 domain-containing protein [Halanaerobiales bacterium]
MDNNELKMTLQKIADNEYNLFEDTDYEKLTNEMLDKIGVTDPKLRDDLIYMVLANWIMDDIYNDDELLKIFNICLDEEHLYYKLGQKKDDSVFTRTFSALILSALFHKDYESDFLNPQKFQSGADKVIEYYSKEQDLRGYIKQKGWAHSAAHGADILVEIAKNKKAKKRTVIKLLESVIDKSQIENYVYFNGEDERISRAVKNAMKNINLDDEAINKWFRELTDIKEIEDRNKKDTLIFNLKNVLKSLYFEIISDEVINDKYLILITDALKELHQKRF